jgi:adenosylcobinamide kinase / adenosylcobinamide-phosphate guanylyltransferase
MWTQLTLILGGARSGKSFYAQSLAERHGGQLLYVATATAGDEEMAQRIAAHRSNRPGNWRTLEAPLNVGKAILSEGLQADFVLVDCLTLLTSNILLGLPEPVSAAGFQAAMDAELDGLLHAWELSPADWAVVSNEVGLGLVPPAPLSRFYRDVLGKANQRLAQAATQVLFMVAGLPMIVKG